MKWGGQKQLGDAAAAALADAKKKAKAEWHWCRRHNGFTDQPVFRLVAKRLDMPPYQVQAFGNRLEEFANDAGNIGHTRGEVGHFDAEEFAIALGMPEEDAARIFAAFEDRGWIVDGHVANFWHRNRDNDESREGAKHRQRRTRARKSIREALADLARRGLVEPGLRLGIEQRLPFVRKMPDDELFALGAELQQAVSTGRHVTRDMRPGDKAGRPVGKSGISKSDQGVPSKRDVTCDFVTVTGEESTLSKALPVDNSGDATRGETEGPSEDGLAGPNDDPQAEQGEARLQQEQGEARLQQDAEVWLESTGVKIVVQRTDEPTPKVARWMQAWLHQRLGGDAVALQEIILGLTEAPLSVGRFLQEMENALQRHRQMPQPQLNFARVLKPTGTGHG